MITRDDWLAAVQDARNAPLPETDALSLAELARLFGVGRPAAERRVDALVARGAAEETTKQIRLRNGGIRTVPAYRLIQK